MLTLALFSCKGSLTTHLNATHKTAERRVGVHVYLRVLDGAREAWGVLRDNPAIKCSLGQNIDTDDIERVPRKYGGRSDGMVGRVRAAITAHSLSVENIVLGI